jgi:hypothetical protein
MKGTECMMQLVPLLVSLKSSRRAYCATVAYNRLLLAGRRSSHFYRKGVEEHDDDMAVLGAAAAAAPTVAKMGSFLDLVQPGKL